MLEPALVSHPNSSLKSWQNQPHPCALAKMGNQATSKIQVIQKQPTAECVCSALNHWEHTPTCNLWDLTPPHPGVLLGDVSCFLRLELAIYFYTGPSCPNLPAKASSLTLKLQVFTPKTDPAWNLDSFCQMVSLPLMRTKPSFSALE